MEEIDMIMRQYATWPALRLGMCTFGSKSSDVENRTTDGFI
jgi:hypothetical protein